MSKTDNEIKTAAGALNPWLGRTESRAGAIKLGCAPRTREERTTLDLTELEVEISSVKTQLQLAAAETGE
jgi:hypothetical protein